MADLKPNIAKNISRLRTANGMTQIDLAEKLNYSDKAVSKWERAESVPDISVLKDIADLFGVSLDYLVNDNDSEPEVAASDTDRIKKNNHGLITGLSILLVWLVATLVFVIVQISAPALRLGWLSFVVAVPVTMIVWLIFNSIWFNRKRNFLIISLLMWSVLTILFLTLPITNTWLVFVLGVPGQIIIILWSQIKKRKK